MKSEKEDGTMKIKVIREEKKYLHACISGIEVGRDITSISLPTSLVTRYKLGLVSGIHIPGNVR